MDHYAITALVVDDDPITRFVVRDCLQHIGCKEIVEASDGLVAQGILQSRDDIDLVITDIIMPRLDGLGLVAWARTECRGPVWVILSALDRFDKAVEAIRLGAFDFLAKPIREEELEVAVRNAVQHQRLTRERTRLQTMLQQKVHELQSKTELLKRDLQRAEVLQRALLPVVPPALHDYHVAALYRPGHYVGGDLYDLRPLDQRHLAFYVADATGHGVTAAMLSVLLKQHIRMTDSAGAAVPPRAVLADANQRLLHLLDTPGLFLTVVYGLLDRETGRLTLASAGHPPVLHQAATGTRRTLPPTGPALGLSAEADFTQHEIVLERGDRVLIYTDGLLEPHAASDISSAWELLQAGDSSALFPLLTRQIERARAGVASEDEVDDVTALAVFRTAGESLFDHGTSTPPRAAVIASAEPVLFCGVTGDEWFLAIRGRGTWKVAELLYDTAAAILSEHHALVLDLADCEYLDSTVLGTVHELVARGKVTLQRVQPGVREQFAELHMAEVLGRIRRAAPPPPLVPIAHGAASADPQPRILQAHEALAAISTGNRDRFRDVLSAMR